MSKIAKLIKTETDLRAMKAKELVEHYNDCAEALKLEPVRRFSDTATGVKRTLKLISELQKKHTVPLVGNTAKRNARRGTNLEPLGHEPMPCREGSKQAALLDMIARPNGATMPELLSALSGGNKPWTEATVRSGFGWDLKNKGYGVRSTFDSDGTERFHVVMPIKYKTIPAHTPLKTPKPKAHAGQSRLA